MTTVPTQIRMIGVVAAVASIGAVFTLVHRPAQQATASHVSTSTAQSGQTGSQPKANNVTVNGVPVKEGTTKLKNGNSTATVNVSGDSASVTTEPTNPSDTSAGNVNISVHSTSSSGTGSGNSGSSYNSSSSSVTSNSSSSVNGDTSSSFTSIQTH